MEIEIIILAQGTQKRLGHNVGPKQLLHLPACRLSILSRTVGQAFHMTRHEMWPTIITWPSVRLERGYVKCEGNTVTPAYVTLADPGNSSLKGIARYLELREQQGRRYARTIVLLGDAVYSWACLEAIWRVSDSFGFVGTADLAGDRGELWGIAWHRDHEQAVLSELRDALLRHPPFDDEYQPGQLRRWITGWRRGDLREHVAKHRYAGSYVDIDDYTHDIDLPTDLALLPELSKAAAADDAQHGITWDLDAGPLSSELG